MLHPCDTARRPLFPHRPRSCSSGLTQLVRLVLHHVSSTLFCHRLLKLAGVPRSLHQNLPGRLASRIFWILITVTIIGTLAFMFAKIFQCTPKNNYYEAAWHGHCINKQACQWSWAAYNILTYTAICILPLPIIMRLKVSIPKRLGTCVLLTVGLLLIAASGLRNDTLKIQSRKIENVGWSESPTAIWSEVEAALSVVAACLPAGSKLLARFLPNKIFGACREGGETTTNRNWAKNRRAVFKGNKGSDSRHNQRPDNRLPTPVIDFRP